VSGTKENTRLVKSLAAVWKEERKRRSEQNTDVPLTPQPSPGKI